MTSSGLVLDPEVVSQLLVCRRNDPLKELTSRDREAHALRFVAHMPSTGGAIPREARVVRPGVSRVWSTASTKVPIGESQSSAANGNRTSNRAPVLRLCADSVPR